MRHNLLQWIAGACATGLCMIATAAQAAPQFKIIHEFCNEEDCADGDAPVSGLLADGSGGYFGVTADGGTASSGTAYQLSPAGKKWKYKVLHSFCSDHTGGHCQDGTIPTGGLIRDDAGNLYGVTGGGGLSNSGIVFQLSPNARKTKWKFKRLYSFCALSSCADGAGPHMALTYAGDASGAPWDGHSPLYGTTNKGGVPGGCKYLEGCGVVFQLKPGKTWTEKPIHAFCVQDKCLDGAYPSMPRLLLDGSGNLFGTVTAGGQTGCNWINNCGAVFELTPKGGKWNYSILYRFCSEEDCQDGAHPLGGVIVDAAGSLYGTSRGGGAGGFYGTVFKLKPDAERTHWTHSILYAFCQQAGCADGYDPESGLAMDAAGNIFGTTYFGGTHGNSGTVFQLKGAYTVLHKFCRDCGAADDAGNVQSGLTLDSHGNLFGVSPQGGHGLLFHGVVYEVTP